MFFSFDHTAVDFLETKQSYLQNSFLEITDIPLIKYIVSTGKPIILSTGIADFNDIELALKTIRDQNNNQIALLKCTSAYPAPIEEANLSMIGELRDNFRGHNWAI